LLIYLFNQLFCGHHLKMKLNNNKKEQKRKYLLSINWWRKWWKKWQGNNERLANRKKM